MKLHSSWQGFWLMKTSHCLSCWDFVESVVKEFLTTAADAKNYQTRFYNFDVIISVGYRVKSHRGTQFRIWATQRLREYVLKGFALDDERLKRAGGGNYFAELRQRFSRAAGCF
jgi:hypothetical protein